MGWTPIVIAASGLVASAVLTGLVRRFALAHGVLDLPNDRSSHSKATPRGGGIAMVLTITIAMLVLTFLGIVQWRLLLALACGGLAVAAVGFIDDRFTVRPGVRLAVHTAAAAWAVAWLGGLPVLDTGRHVIHLGWPGAALATLGIVWTLNLFNFMDGIDGIAASEAMFVAGAGTVLGVMAGNGEVSASSLVIACASAGFLLWNWPPAKIFMGDVGSGYLGYVLAVLSLRASARDPVALWVWLILGAAFFVDATLTLARRSLRGERVHEAHRSHAYQWLARRWKSHRRVTLVFLALNLLWLLPCALAASRRPDLALRLLLVACGPLVLLGALAGAGRRETATNP